MFYEPIILKNTLRDQERTLRSDSDTEDQTERRTELEMATAAFELLNHYYAGHLWITQVDSNSGMLCVQLGVLMDSNRWYKIRAADLNNAMELAHAVRRAGGELLERFGLRRKHLELDRFLHARATKRLFSRHDPMPEGITSE